MKQKTRYTLVASIIAGSAALVCAGMQVVPRETVKAMESTETIVDISSVDLSISPHGQFVIESMETSPQTYTEVVEGYSETESYLEETETESVLTDRNYYNIKLSEEVQDHLFFICDQYNIDSSLVVAIIERESSFRDWVVGDKGESFGLMQIKEKYHRAQMEALGCTDLLNPYHNITVGVDKLWNLFQQNPDVYWVLMAYNGGCSYANRCYIEQDLISDYAREICERAEYYSMQIN